MAPHKNSSPLLEHAGPVRAPGTLAKWRLVPSDAWTVVAEHLATSDLGAWARSAPDMSSLVGNATTRLVVRPLADEPIAKALSRAASRAAKGVPVQGVTVHVPGCPNDWCLSPLLAALGRAFPSLVALWLRLPAASKPCHRFFRETPTLFAPSLPQLRELVIQGTCWHDMPGADRVVPCVSRAAPGLSRLQVLVAREAVEQDSVVPDWSDALRMASLRDLRVGAVDFARLPGPPPAGCASLRRLHLARATGLCTAPGPGLFAALTELHVSSCAGPVHFAAVLAAAPRLRVLVLGDMQHSHTLAGAEPVASSSLESLSLADRLGVGRLPAAALPALRDLRLEGFYLRDLEAFLGESPGLESLCLKGGCSSDRCLLDTLAGLCPALRRLELLGLGDELDLSHCQGPFDCLEQLVLDTKVGGPGACLGPSAFPALRRLSLSKAVFSRGRERLRQSPVGHLEVDLPALAVLSTTKWDWDWGGDERTGQGLAVRMVLPAATSVDLSALAAASAVFAELRLGQATRLDLSVWSGGSVVVGDLGAVDQVLLPPRPGSLGACVQRLLAQRGVPAAAAIHAHRVRLCMAPLHQAVLSGQWCPRALSTALLDLPRPCFADPGVRSALRFLEQHMASWTECGLGMARLKPLPPPGLSASELSARFQLLVDALEHHIRTPTELLLPGLATEPVDCTCWFLPEGIDSPEDAARKPQDPPSYDPSRCVPEHMLSGLRDTIAAGTPPEPADTQAPWWAAAETRAHRWPPRHAGFGGREPRPRPDTLRGAVGFSLAPQPQARPLPFRFGGPGARRRPAGSRLGTPPSDARSGAHVDRRPHRPTRPPPEPTQAPTGAPPYALASASTSAPCFPTADPRGSPTPTGSALSPISVGSGSSDSDSSVFDESDFGDSDSDCSVFEVAPDGRGNDDSDSDSSVSECSVFDVPDFGESDWSSGSEAAEPTPSSPADQDPAVGGRSPADTSTSCGSD